MEVEGRCRKLYPECICARCSNNRMGEDGVKCCWTAGKRVIHHIRTSCSVRECPEFQAFMPEENESFRKGHKGHKKVKGNFLNYTVYDNKTDFPIIVGGSAQECAKAMGITLQSFFNAVDRSRKGLNKRWTILSEWEDEEQEEENAES